MTVGMLDLGGKPLKSRWTHMLTSDVRVVIEAQDGTFDPATIYTWEFANIAATVLTATVSSDHLSLTFTAPALVADALPDGVGYGLFTTQGAPPVRQCWAIGRVSCVSAAT